MSKFVKLLLPRWSGRVVNFYLLMSVICTSPLESLLTLFERFAIALVC